MKSTLCEQWRIFYSWLPSAIGVVALSLVLLMHLSIYDKMLACTYTQIKSNYITHILCGWQTALYQSLYWKAVCSFLHIHHIIHFFYFSFFFTLKLNCTTQCKRSFFYSFFFIVCSPLRWMRIYAKDGGKASTKNQ